MLPLGVPESSTATSSALWSTAKDLPSQCPLHMPLGALQGLAHKGTLSPAPEGPVYPTVVQGGPVGTRLNLSVGRKTEGLEEGLVQEQVLGPAVSVSTVLA